MDPNKQKHQFYANCIRQFNNAKLVKNYTMDKENARVVFKSMSKEYSGFRITFFKFMMDMLDLKVIQRPKDYSKFIFRASVFDAIIMDKEYAISKPISKTIVNQSYAFKNRPKESATQQNGKPAKKAPQKEKNLVVEVNPGMGEYKEHINCFDLSNVRVKAKNCSLDIIDIINIKSHSPKNVTVPPFLNTIKLLPGEEYVLNILVQIQEISACSCVLFFECTKNGDTFLTTKQLYLEYFPKNYNELLPKAVYKRSKPVIKEIDFVIISGEIPEPVTSFKPKIPLNPYSLTKDFIHVINQGLKLDGLNPNCQRLCKTIIETLNVPNPSHPLTPANYCELLNLLLDIEEHQMQIDIRNYDMVEGKLDKAGRLYSLEVLGLSENRPSLIVGDYVDITDIEGKTKFRGFVHEKKLDRVHISLNKSFADVYLKNKSFHVSFGYNRTTIKLEHRAVQILKESGVEKCFFPLYTNGNMYTDLGLQWINPNCTLNEEQKCAVKHILNKTAYPAPYLIFGPPGTGKTMTVVEAIQQVYKTQPDKRILVCTPSNNAANVINLRMLNIPKRDLLRYISYSFPYIEIDTKIIDYCNYKFGEFYHPHINELLNKRIVITTLTNAGRLLSAGVPSGHFDYIFIDESGHATETETLIPLAGMFSNAKTGQLTGQIVLVGDPMQLGPIIHSAIAGKYGFDISMLERLMTTIDLYKKNNNGYNNNVLTKLLENYRSHEEILKISNDKFYDGELIPKAGHLSALAIGADILINKKYPMIFHSTFGQDLREESSPSFFNIVECTEVMKYLDRLVGSRMQGMLIKQEHIGIITPYRKQVKKLKQLCDKGKFKDVTIGSVEQFQGQERLIIIISTVRSSVENIQHDRRFHLGFLKNPKRFNVAITRAKALVIVIGNPDILQYDEHWRAYIKACVDNNAITGKTFTLKSQEELMNDNSYQLISSMQNLQINDDKVFKRGDI